MLCKSNIYIDKFMYLHVLERIDNFHTIIYCIIIVNIIKAKIISPHFYYRVEFDDPAPQHLYYNGLIKFIDLPGKSSQQIHV